MTIINRKLPQSGAAAAPVTADPDWAQANVLAIETSSRMCCVALRSGGAVTVDNRAAERSHNALLLQMISDQCAVAGIAPGELDGIGCGAGPGSFTGVRIGVAAAQALALAAAAPIAMVNSLDILAHTVSVRAEHDQSLHARVAEGFICARRSRAEAFYLALYQRQPKAAAAGAIDADGAQGPPLALKRGPMILCDSQSRYAAWQQDTRTTALDPPLFGEVPGWLVAAADRVPEGAIETDGVAAMELALAALERGEGVAAAAAVPVYLPEDSPWRSR